MLSELKENLLKAGKSEGCISFDDLNDLLPDEIKDPRDIEKVFNFLGDHNIEIVTEEKSGEKRTLSGEVWEKNKDSSGDGDEDEPALGFSENDEHDAEETTTTYLREMGRFDLLTPEEHLDIFYEFKGADTSNKKKEIQ